MGGCVQKNAGCSLAEVAGQMKYTKLSMVKIGERFELCRTGDVYTLVAARPETPSGYRRDCVDHDGVVKNLHHNCKVRVIPNTQG